METTAARVASELLAGGVDVLFAFPGGGSNLDLMEAFADRGGRVVLTRSEGGAAFMAAAHAELRGRPGAILIGLGPGVSNAVNGVAHAWLDQSALVVLSDRPQTDGLGVSGHQLLAQRALLRPVTKLDATLAPADAAQAVREALAVAIAPPRGPVHVELSARDASAEAAPATGPVGRTLPAGGDLASAAELVARARRPLILVGDEAYDAADGLAELAGRLRAPVLTTPRGKGAFPDEHPLWAGVLTGAAIEAPLLERADLLLSAGVDPVELLPRPWGATAPLVGLREHEDATTHLRPALTVLGGVGSLTERLCGMLAQPASEWHGDEAGAERERVLGSLRLSVEQGMTAVEVVESVQAESPAGATVAVDAGAHMFAALWFWRAARPRSFLISNGLATMGFAVPAAIGAALARPGEPVLALTGDGGFLLHGAELETAARLGLPVVVCVLNDASLSLIRIKQEDRGLARRGVDFGDARLDLVGAGLGARTASADDVDGLRRAVREAFDRPGPSLVEARLPGSEYRALQHAIRGGAVAGAAGGGGS